MVKRMAKLVWVVLAISLAFPACAEVFTDSQGLFSIQVPEELGSWHFISNEKGSVLVRFEDILLKDEAEWGLIYIQKENNEMHFLGDELANAALLNVLAQKGATANTIPLALPDQSMIQINLPDVEQAAGKTTFYTARGQYVWVIYAENMSPDTAAQLLSGLSFLPEGSLPSAEAPDQPAPEALPAAPDIHVAGGAECPLPEIPARTQLPEGLYVLYPKGNSDEVVSLQSLSASDIEAYLNLQNYTAIIMPAGYGVKNAPYFIGIRVKEDSAFKTMTSDFATLDDATLKLLDDTFYSGMAIAGKNQQFPIHRSPTRPFGKMIFMGKMRYYTVINNKLVYFILNTREGEAGPEQLACLDFIVDHFTAP